MRVLLLKTKSAPEDGYETYFKNPENGSFTPVFVPVLAHNFNTASLQHVRSLILARSFSTDNDNTLTHRYGALIFTSQRAVGAFSQIVRELRAEIGSGIDELLPATLSLYVVGPATARGLAALDLLCSIQGEESGNGEALAHFILENYNTKCGAPVSDAGATRAPLLFLVGEQRRDIIPKTLEDEKLPKEKHIKVDELVVYETGVMQSFPNDFAAALREAHERESLWIVVFSPTGCKAMLEGLNMLDTSTGKVQQNLSSTDRRARIATIGPTTRDYLRKEFGFNPDVCAETPSPEGVGAGIQNFV